MPKVAVESKLVDESEKYLWYIRSDGKAYRVDKETKEKYFLKQMLSPRGEVLFKINGHIYLAKTLVAQSFKRNWHAGDVIVFKNGKKEDVRNSNLVVISKEKFMSNIAKRPGIAVVQYDENGQIVKTWDSIASCAAEIGYDKSNLARALRSGKNIMNIKKVEQ